MNEMVGKTTGRGSLSAFKLQHKKNIEGAYVNLLDVLLEGIVTGGGHTTGEANQSDH